MKIYLSDINESWIVDRVRNDWYEHNMQISTQKIKDSDIIWIISPWIWRKLPKRHLKKKKVICSIYHIDFEKFDKNDEKDFYERDQFVDFYHVISKKTYDQLRKLTDKKITSIPFWVDQNLWFEINNKQALREKYGLNKTDYLVGSFQRDTEGHDLKSPKLIKGPDIFLEIVTSMYEKNKNLKVVLSGKRRNYLIENFKNRNLPFVYFEMIDLKELNELYNILDLYIVTSRIEGGPQAILECAVSKTPIVSTDVGVASEILDSKSIFKPEEFNDAIPNTTMAFKNSQDYIIPNGMIKFKKMFEDLYEN